MRSGVNTVGGKIHGHGDVTELERLTTCLPIGGVDATRVIDAIADQPGQIQLVARLVVVKPVMDAIAPPGPTAFAFSTGFH